MPKVTSILVLNCYHQGARQLVNQRNANSYKRAYIYIFINTELGGNKGHQEETHPTHRSERLFLDLLPMDDEDVPAPWVRSNSHPPVRVQNHVSINSYSITNAVGDFLLSIIPNSVIVWSLQYNIFFAIIDRCSIMTGMYSRSMMIYIIP